MRLIEFIDSLPDDPWIKIHIPSQDPDLYPFTWSGYKRTVRRSLTAGNGSFSYVLYLKVLDYKEEKSKVLPVRNITVWLEEDE